MTDKALPTPRQIRAARALLDWSVHELAAKIGVVGTTISAIERRKIAGSMQTLKAITRALEGAGVEFTPDEGVRPAQNRIRVLRGRDGLETFYNEIYDYACTDTPRLCALAGRIAELRHWIGDFRVAHIRRMEALGLDKKGRRGHYIFPDTHKDNLAVSYEEPRYLPARMFPDTSIYILGDRIGMIDFQDDDVEILVIDNPKIAESHYKIFDGLWEIAKTTPKK